jgi:hypothetical protein
VRARLTRLLPLQFASQVDATAFLIDAGPHMLLPHTVALDDDQVDVFGHSLSFLGLAIRLVEQTMRNKCVSGVVKAAARATRAEAAARCVLRRR